MTGPLCDATIITATFLVPPPASTGRPVTAENDQLVQVLPEVQQRRHTWLKNLGPDPVRFLGQTGLPRDQGYTLPAGERLELWGGGELFAMLEPAFVSATIAIFSELEQ